MTSIVLMGARARGAFALARLGRAIGRLSRWLECRRAERRLMALGDDRLKDIGLSRAEIARAVREGRRRT